MSLLEIEHVRTRPAAAPATEAVLACSGLRKRFGELLATDGVGFSVAPGEVYGLLGPNGAGKTTTISMVAGILAPDEGWVEVGSAAVTTRTVGVRAAIGYVPQDLAVYPDLTGRENLDFFARLYDMKGVLKRSRIDEVLTTIGLEDRADDLVKNYSGGMKRRLNIGIGLLHQPRLLILDEPTVGVDPQSRNAIMDSVAALSNEGMAVLYTTHYMEEAERLCDRVGIMDLGRLIAEGTPRELVKMVGEDDTIRISARGPLRDAAQRCRTSSGVREVSVSKDELVMVVTDARSVLTEILSAVDDVGVSVVSVEVHEPNLESVFLHLTGKALRD